jgi:quercetin dioxygenase-like cupin family protein
MTQDEDRNRREFWFLDTRVVVRVSVEDGDNQMSVLEQWAPEGDSPPLHLHKDQDEIFHLIEGEMRFRVGGQDLPARAGDTLLAPKGVAHTYRVLSQTGAHLLVITKGGQFERFVCSMARPAERDGLPDPAGPPAPERLQTLASAAAQHGIEIVGPPLEI